MAYEDQELQDQEEDEEDKEELYGGDAGYEDNSGDEKEIDSL